MDYLEFYGNFYGLFENVRAENKLMKIKTSNKEVYKILLNVKNSRPVGQKYQMWETQI